MEKNFYDVYIQIKKANKFGVFYLHRHSHLNHIQAETEEEATEYAINKIRDWSDFSVLYPNEDLIKIETVTTLCKKIHLTGKQQTPKL